MKIILSPAKKMNADTDTLAYAGLPRYLEQTEELSGWLRGKTYEELKKFWGCITCVFGEWINGKIAQKGTYAKMARGEMVRFMAEKEIENREEIKKFDRLGYVFREELSSEKNYIFIKK